MPQQTLKPKKIVMRKQVDNCEDGDIEKGKPLLTDQNSTANIAPPKEETEFSDFFTGNDMSFMTLGAWKPVSFDDYATRNRYKDYNATCAHSPIKVLDMIFILPMLFRQLWNIYRMEIALRFVADVEKYRKDGKYLRLPLRGACQSLYNTPRDDLYNGWLTALFLGGLSCFLLTVGDFQDQKAFLGFIFLAVLMNCLCLGGALVCRFDSGTLLSLAVLSSCAAGLFRVALVPEAFIWIHRWIDGMLSFCYAAVGLGLSDVFVNWDILTRESALGGFCGGAFACFSVFLNFSVFVPLPVLPSLLFGFSFGLPLSKISHLESSVVLGEPSAAYISWVTFVSKACFSVAIGIFLYSALVTALKYCDGTCFDTTVLGVELITATMTDQVTSYMELFT